MAERRSIKEIKAQGRADQKAIGGAQRKRRSQFVKERDSIHGAAALAQRAVEGTRLTGLKGRYRRQMQKEIAGRSRDLAVSLPFMLAEAQRAYKEDRASLRDSLRASRADTQAAIQEELAARLQEQREATKERKGEIRFALKQAKRLALFDADGNVLPRPDLPSSREEWIKFEEALSGREGVSPEAARAAVNRMRRKQQMIASARRFAPDGW